MPKHDPFSPKGIANRMKAKGLQKLRWYCQMCQKQCRDDNGFRAHTQSEGHHRQMRLFADNHSRILTQYSSQFLGDFLKVLSSRFGTKRVFANQVYQAYISDKNHVHMNATRWTALAGFVRFLGRSKICEVDETEKGWYIRWIDKSPSTMARLMAKEKREKSDLGDEERQRRRLEELVEYAQDQARQVIQEAEAHGYGDEDDESKGAADDGQLPRPEGMVGEDGKIKLNLSLSLKSVGTNGDGKRRTNPFKAFASKVALDDDARSTIAPSVADSAHTVGGVGRKITAMEEIRLAEEERKRRMAGAFRHVGTGAQPQAYAKRQRIG